MAANLTNLLHHRHPLSTADIPTLGGIVIGSAGFWSMVYFLNHTFMHKVKKMNKEFHSLNESEKALYLSRVPAALHAFVAFILAAIVIFGTW